MFCLTGWVGSVEGLTGCCNEIPIPLRGMINARVETLTQRPAFRGLLSHNRALVPACGYYEWQGEGRAKTPYYIHPQDKPFIAFAGLYDAWQRPDGEDLYTFTIITTDADPFMARLHNRMPVILARELEDAWLDPELTQAQDILNQSTEDWYTLVSPNTGQSGSPVMCLCQCRVVRFRPALAKHRPGTGRVPGVANGQQTKRR